MLELSITVVAEGVETIDQVKALQDLGIRLLQGYYFARPALKALPEIASDAFAGPK